MDPGRGARVLDGGNRTEVHAGFVVYISGVDGYEESSRRMLRSISVRNRTMIIILIRFVA